MKKNTEAFSIQKMLRSRCIWCVPLCTWQTLTLGTVICTAKPSLSWKSLQPRAGAQHRGAVCNNWGDPQCQDLVSSTVKEEMLKYSTILAPALCWFKHTVYIPWMQVFRGTGNVAFHFVSHSTWYSVFVTNCGLLPGFLIELTGQ
jgi:hypothetical protein